MIWIILQYSNMACRMWSSSLIAVFVLFIASIFANEEYERNIFSSTSYSNKLVVNCLNIDGNYGKYLISVYYADLTQTPMWRAQALRGTCAPGKLDRTIFL